MLCEEGQAGSVLNKLNDHLLNVELTALYITYYIDSDGFRYATLAVGIVCILISPFVWKFKSIGQLPGQQDIETSGSLFGFSGLKNSSIVNGYRRTNSASSNEFVDSFFNSETF